MERGLLGGGKGGSGKGAVLKNTEKEYNRAVKNGELKGNDKAAMRAILDRMEARDTLRRR